MFDGVFSSPLVRAVQTAEIFSSVLKYEGEIITAAELSGGHTFTRFMQFLKRNSHHKSIGIFAHAPDVNTYSVNLIKDDNIKLNFKNLSVCKINYDFEDDAGEFIWFLNSDDLKLIEK
jgi:phosphohistidine phosphatase SixA